MPSSSKDMPAILSYNSGMYGNIDKVQWQKKYRETSRMLEIIRDRELRALTDADVWRRIQTLKVPGKPWRERPDWSGLVEQQALFHRRRKQP
ncbi:MAG: hypothetical protein ACP5I8_01475 [Phycisphaerae bacterium]